LNPNPFYPEAADVDCDGSITADDATRIAEYAAGLRRYFPECLGAIQYDQYDYTSDWTTQLTLFTEWNEGYCAQVDVLNTTQPSTASSSSSPPPTSKNARSSST
jgi:cellulase/cellobiase CelA1